MIQRSMDCVVQTENTFVYDEGWGPPRLRCEGNCGLIGAPYCIFKASIGSALFAVKERVPLASNCSIEFLMCYQAMFL